MTRSLTLPDWFKKLDRDGKWAISLEEMTKLFFQRDVGQDDILKLNEGQAYYRNRRGSK